ncbi:MAG: hypothetical protein ACLQPV_03125 [Vulcanimicrobiaceae bacterium]
MHQRLIFLAFAAAASLAACGGGGGTSGGGSLYGGNPPATSPPATSAPQSGNIPTKDTVAGSPAWVDPSSHHTLYYLDGDPANGSGCTSSGGCSTEWPPMSAASGSTAQGNMQMITRTDGTTQWSYEGKPLFHFSGDGGADQSNGVYGPWHVARPNASATPAPGGGGCGNYC